MPSPRCRLVSGREAVGVFPAACSSTAVPVVSALAFVLEYQERFGTRLLQNLVRRHCDLFGTMFGTSLRCSRCAALAESLMNTALLLCMGKRSRSTTIENGVRLLMSLRRCSHLNLQLFGIHAGFHAPFLLPACFGVFGTRPEMFGTFGKHLMSSCTEHQWFGTLCGTSLLLLSRQVLLCLGVASRCGVSC